MKISVMQRVFGVPLLCHPARAIEIARYLGDRGGYEVLADQERSSDKGRDRPYQVINHIARVPIEGTLVHKSGWVDAFSGLSGYDGIRSILDQALLDADVRGIALMVNSPGGEVAGMFALADRIFEARDIKPIWAILDESAYSAAYALASCASYVTVPRTGGTGSIGVIAMHAEESRALDQAGITVTVMRYGERKARANSVEPLMDDDRADLQADIDRIGEDFIALVARNRDIKAADIRKQQAATFMGESGVDRDLADLVATPETALTIFEELING